MCGIEAMLKTFVIPEEPFVDVGDMTLGVLPPYNDLDAGHAQALSTDEYKHYIRRTKRNGVGAMPRRDTASSPSTVDVGSQ